MDSDRKRKHVSENDSEDSSSSLSSSETEEKAHKKRKRHSKEKKRRHSSTSVKKKKKKKETSKLSKDSISEDDYFLKSTEFRLWLNEEKSIYFSDLTSEQSRKLFRKFVRRWNSGNLKKKYYAGIESSSLSHTSQTKYKWKLSSDTQDQLHSMRDQVSSWTGGSFKDEKTPSGPFQSSSKGMIGPQKEPVVLKKRDPFEEEEEQERQQDHLRKERKAYRKYNEMVMDELLPKPATAFAARLEKKKVRAEARRERDISPDVSESTLMGGETSFNIKNKLRLQQEEKEHKAQVASQKISDYQAKEKARVAAILEMAKANKKEGAIW